MDLQPVKKWECSKCPKTFKTKDKLNRHVITHDPDAKVKCEVCGKVSKNRHALTAHVSNQHTNRVRPSCDTCDQVFYNATNLREHIKIAHSTSQRPRFSCKFPSCEKTYQNKGHILRHVKTEHAENSVRFPCPLCISEFTTRQDLGTHISTHLTEEPFNCATCGRSFARKWDMKSHEMTHLDKSVPDRSKCDACPQTFLRRNNLQRHVRIVHEKQRNYPCAFCDKRFSTSANLKVHAESKHATNKELIHSCDMCEFKTHSEADLILHGKRHEPGNDSQES